MLRFADLVEKHNDEIAALETWDNGKPYEQSAKVEIPIVVRLFRYYAGKCADITVSIFFTMNIHDELIYAHFYRYF